MKLRGGNRIVEKNITRRGIEKSIKKREVEYLDVGYKGNTTFIIIIIFETCRREGV
jgi:hypothetical protein